MDSTRISLDGTWQLRWTSHVRGDKAVRVNSPAADMSRAIDAAVPGEVHLDLMKAGIIDDPGVGLNCLKARWVEEFIWFYRRTLQAPTLRPEQRAYLIFDTLDLGATVYLNGVEVARHCNAFYPLRVDVTGKLQAGENLLVVALESGLYTTAGKSLGLGADNILHKRHWLRQTQSTFGWDWSERLLNVGIRGHVSLEIGSEVRVEGFAALAKVSEDMAEGTVTGRFFVEGLDQQTREATLVLEVAQASAGETPATLSQPVQIKPGQCTVEATLTVRDPRLWWPVNHGRQELYTVTARLDVAGKTIARDSRRIGFRHVRVNQSPHPAGGTYFTIEVNHKPIFCKGGNVVPADLIMARLDRQRYATLVDRALEANFNFLRIWGGGLYESDDLYDLADEKGLLVWQEFIFACAKYPGTDLDFFNDVRREATHQVRRLAHHASLAIWCGNNELEWLVCDIEKQHEMAALPDYGIFHKLLPTILSREDGTRFYWPSSPHSPDYQFSNRDDTGDQHPWSIGFADTDFRGYRAMACRFPNEGGILGPTALPTVRACLERDVASRCASGPSAVQGTNVASRCTSGPSAVQTMAWEIHDNSVNYWGERPHADDMLQQWLGIGLAQMSVEDYVYWGGVVQGEGLAEYIRNFRRRMFDTSSAIFWMYNDCWPMVRSWTIVDYYQRRTPSFHPVRRALRPVTVAVVCDAGKVMVFGINEGPAFSGQVRYGIFALAGGMPMDRGKAVTLPANTSTLIDQFDLAELTRLGETTHGAFAVLSEQGGRQVAQDRLFMPYFKDMAWPKANLKIRQDPGRVTFQSDTFVWRVCLDLDGERVMPDNFFDVLPGIPLTLDWPAELGECRVLRVGNDIRNEH